MYTPNQAIEAIQARTKGVWDNEQLRKLGDLFPDAETDILRIIELTDSEPAQPHRLHVIEVTFLPKTETVVLISHYRTEEYAIPLNNEPGSITPALDTAKKYLATQGFNILGYCAGKGGGTNHIVTDTFKSLVCE